LLFGVSWALATPIKRAVQKGRAKFNMGRPEKEKYEFPHKRALEHLASTNSGDLSRFCPT
jgi:hypothetical protein